MASRTKHPPGDDKSLAAEQQLRAANQQLRATEQQLRAANQQLHVSEQQLRAANQQLRAHQQELRELNRDLQNRVRELDCLYGLSQLVETRDTSLEQIFEGLVSLIPAAWQYPEITAVRITLEGRRFKTPNFRKTKWIQFADINVHKRKAGVLEVCYLRKKPIVDEGPFLKQEKDLLNALAERLGRIVERWHAEEELKAANQQLEAANQQLRDSEQRYRNVYDTAPLAFVLWDRRCHITNWNKHSESLFGWTREEVLGRNFFEFLIPETARPNVQDIVNALIRGELPSHNINENITKTGQIVLCEWNNSVCYDDEGRVVEIISLALDITKRKQAKEALQAANQQLEAANQQLRASEQQLKAANQQLKAANQQLRAGEKQLLAYHGQLKSLSSQLTLTEEHERHQIAMELHATIGQSLVSSKLQLDTLRASLPSGGELAKTLEVVCNSLEETIDQMRTLVFDLSSPVLYELGFETAVAAWLDEQIRQKHRINCEFEDDGRAKPLDDDIRITLFRDVRELLINVVKHARANKVKVSVSKVGDRIHVTVEDDGWGFDPKEIAATGTTKGGFGLFSIRERLEQLGGHLEIKSAPGCGCKVTMVAPLKEESENRHHESSEGFVGPK